MTRVAASLFFVLLLLPSIAGASPTIDRPIVDEVGVLDPVVRERLDARLREHADAGRATIALLLVRSTDGEPIEDYANRIATAWGGSASARDALVVFALDDHRDRIELGRGLEETLSDGDVTRMLHDLRPFLRAGETTRAVWHLVDELIVATGGVHDELPLVAGTSRSPAVPESRVDDREPPRPETGFLGTIVRSDLGVSLALHASWIVLLLVYPFVRRNLAASAGPASVAVLPVFMRLFVLGLVVWTLVASIAADDGIVRFFHGVFGLGFTSIFGIVLAQLGARASGDPNARAFLGFGEYDPSASPERRHAGSPWSMGSSGVSSHDSSYDTTSSYDTSSSHDSSSSSSDSYGDGGGSFDGGGGSDSW